MSRVHDALRRAEQYLDNPDLNPPEQELPTDGVPVAARSAVLSHALEEPADTGHDIHIAAPDGIDPVEAISPFERIPRASQSEYQSALHMPQPRQVEINWREFLGRCEVIPFHPAPEAHLIDVERPHEVPGEEFRSLRTRLNHMQGQQNLHSIVVTSASPAEGKTFTAVNLALAQAQLEHPCLIVDLDLRRPVVHNLLQSPRSPGFSDFIIDERPLEECIRRIGNTNLFFLPAGTQVKNPLELLNMRQVKYTLDGFRKIFNWIILDTPPLLFSADANLLATLTDGTIIVVRIGSTTYDNVIRAMQSLCENNVLGIVANGARAGELYSKYTYYYSKQEE